MLKSRGMGLEGFFLAWTCDTFLGIRMETPLPRSWQGLGSRIEAGTIIHCDRGRCGSTESRFDQYMYAETLSRRVFARSFFFSRVSETTRNAVLV